MMMIKKPVDEKLKNMVFNTVRMANDDATVPNDASEDVVKVSDQATENFYNSEKKKNNVDHMDKSTMYVKAAKTIDDNVKTIHLNFKKQMDNCEELIDDTTKIDDENPVDTNGHSQMKGSTNLLTLLDTIKSLSQFICWKEQLHYFNLELVLLIHTWS